MHVELEHLAGDELGGLDGLGPGAQRIQRVFGIPIAGRAEECLLGVVVLACLKDVSRVVLEVVFSGASNRVVPRPGLGHRHHVLFGEIAVSDGEEFHELTSEVLLLGALHVGLVVEVHEHRWAETDSLQEVTKASPTDLTHVDVLIPQRFCKFDLFASRGEVAVPEERQLLLDGRR